MTSLPKHFDFSLPEPELIEKKSPAVIGTELSTFPRTQSTVSTQAQNSPGCANLIILVKLGFLSYTLEISSIKA